MISIGRNTPPVRFRASLQLVEVLPSGCAKYRLTHWGGSKEYMKILHTFGRGKKDKQTGRSEIIVRLKKNYQGADPSTDTNLEMKNGYNLTGVKEWVVDGFLSGFAYGEPMPKATFKRNGKKIPNPLYEYREDGYIFLTTPNPKDPKDHIPVEIHWVVLQGRGMRGLVSSYIPQFREGGFRDILEAIPLKEYAEGDFMENVSLDLFQNLNEDV